MSALAHLDFGWVRNERVKAYAPGSADRAALRQAVDAAYNRVDEVPCVIGGKEIFTGNVETLTMPTEHKKEICKYHIAGEKEIQMAIDAAMSPEAKDWATWPFEDRAAVFLKAADLCAGKYREELSAVIMLSTAKTPRETDIDNTEISDFYRFGVKNAAQIYEIQPPSLYCAQNYWNRLEHRPLEGFVLAVAPFNFCALGANLAGIPALMGNTVFFKPSTTAVQESYFMMRILKEAGLPDGVINFVPCSGQMAGDKVIPHKDLAGVNFTGSTATFNRIWQTVASNIDAYKSYPRIVGETGGKNFHFVHESADVKSVISHTVRGAFDYQGQKCSAASRMYVPANLWESQLKEGFAEATKQVKMGCSTDFNSFMCSVIDRAAFDKLSAYLKRVKESSDAEILVGGGCDDSVGYFIEPTVVVTKNPAYETMCDELFGPVFTVFVYDPKEYEETLRLCDASSKYALTGTIFAQDRRAVRTADKFLKNAAGNYYVNDKCTGAAVGEQPFGGSRKSGTNDKSGTIFNNLRWVSQRTIKETFEPLSSPLWPCNSAMP